MAKLFIGCDYIDFMHANTPYSGVLSKIILEDKTIFRVDFACHKSYHSGRYEVCYKKDPVSQKPKWEPHTDVDPGIAQVLRSQIEKNERVLQLA
jgi:hypothetical protein